MHRLTNGSVHPALPASLAPALPLALTLLLALGAGCAHRRVEVQDPPHVEQLRVRISKVRHAIAETRQAIARSQGAPYLPELYVRLAELQSEEAKYHYQVAYEREQRSSKNLHVPQVRLLKERALGLYRLVLRRYPDSALAPRVLFNIGHEQRELGNYEEMLQALDELVTKYPRSALRSEALLVLGDYYFDKNELPKAEDYYRKILEGDATRVTGLAHYKIGWVRVNRGDCKNALDHFAGAVLTSRALLEGAEGLTGEAAKQTASGQNVDVRREALVDLTYCYTRERKASQAVDYVRRLASNRAAYIAALERLAARYGMTSQADGAIPVARELLALAPDAPERLDDARMLYSSLKRAKRYGRIGQDLRLITGAMLRATLQPDMKEEARAQLVEEVEKYARDLATRAQGRLRLRRGGGTSLRAVAEAYEAYLDAFPDSEHRGEVLANLADVLGRQGDHLGAGRRYLEAAPLLEEKEQRDAYYDAVVRLQRSLEKADEQSHVERVVARAGLRRAGSELLKHPLSEERARRVRFAIARTWYDEGQHARAIDALTAVAYQYPGTTESNAAAHMVLDAFQTLNDAEGLMTAGHRFVADDSPLPAKLKAELRPLVATAEQRRIDELSLQAAGDEGGGIAELESFAARYQGTDLGERALLNAFVAARAAGDSRKLYELGDALASGYPKSDQLPGMLATLARTATARFELDRAIDFFRKAAAVNPAERVALLVAGGGLLEQLADEEGALRMYREALRTASGPARTLPASAIAELLERRDDPRALVSALAPLASFGGPEVLARLGLAQLRTGDVDSAEMTLSSVLDSAEGASPGAQARAQYGLAEVLGAALQGYRPAGDVESVQELIALVEVTEQTYLGAVRQADPLFTAAALLRLATLSRGSADKMAMLPLPPSLTDAEREAVRGALLQRGEALKAQADEAIAACRNQAWNNGAFNAAVRRCLSEDPYAGSPLAFDALTARDAAKLTDEDGAVEAIRARLSKNPRDVEGLRELGERFLDAGDAHAARLVFARAIQEGGTAEVHNLLGIAHLQSGDVTGALESFSQAAAGGLEAGRQNLARALTTQGLDAAAKYALEKLPQGEGEGRLLPASGAIAKGGAS